MNFELAKEEYIKLKKEKFNYIDNISKISSKKELSEYEKLEIYRSLKEYEFKLTEAIKRIKNEAFKIRGDLTTNCLLRNTIIEFDLEKSFLSSINPDKKKIIFDQLKIDIETFKFKSNLHYLFYYYNENMTRLDDIIQKPIYVWSGYYDYSEDCIGPLFGDPKDYIYSIYRSVYDLHDCAIEIPNKEKDKFEKDKLIIHSTRYVNYFEIGRIFEEELLNTKNKSLNDCVTATNERIKNLNYTRTPEYKEKVLLDRINELYKNVKGEFIQSETLYNGKILSILRETYKLPNERIVNKEKVIKNNGKNAVIVIAITKDNKFLITFQNRINDKLIAEFPAGYIEENEDVLEAAKRELQEETGYTSDNLFIVDSVYTSPGIDNSITYIVIANNSIKTCETKTDGTELVNYGLFSENELQYLIINNIMCGAINKLAFYSLVNNTDHCNIIYAKTDTTIYVRKKELKNPLDN